MCNEKIKKEQHHYFQKKTKTKKTKSRVAYKNMNIQQSTDLIINNSNCN